MGVSYLKRDLYNYDWKTYQLVVLAWCPWFFGAIFVTIFYYGFFFWLSNLLFGGMNLYIQGILAGISGGVWGYGITHGYRTQNEIESNIDAYSNSKYNDLLKTRLIRTFFFLSLISVEGVSVTRVSPPR